MAFSGGTKNLTQLEPLKAEYLQAEFNPSAALRKLTKCFKCLTGKCYHFSRVAAHFLVSAPR